MMMVGLLVVCCMKFLIFIRVFAGEKQKEQCDDDDCVVSLTKQQGEVG